MKTQFVKNNVPVKPNNQAICASMRVISLSETELPNISTATLQEIVNNNELYYKLCPKDSNVRNPAK